MTHNTGTLGKELVLIFSVVLSLIGIMALFAYYDTTTGSIGQWSNAFYHFIMRT